MPNVLFNMDSTASVGAVYKVDSYRISVHVPAAEQIRQVRVHGYLLIHTVDPNTRLIGRVERVLRAEQEMRGEEAEETFFHNEITVLALGTLKGSGGGRAHPSFSRAVEVLPEIGAACFWLSGRYLTAFVNLIALETALSETALSLGTYALTPNARALLDGNAFFQRHALITGSTGSGKSWTVAHIVEQVAGLNQCNLVLFDLHGEYEPLAAHPHITRYKLAGHADIQSPSDNTLFFPYWLLGYEDMLALLLDRSDDHAPNQAAAFTKAVIRAKRAALIKEGLKDELDTFTIDSPLPYCLEQVINELTFLNEERTINPSTNREINGPMNGKLSRFLSRLAARRTDRRYAFLFPPHQQAQSATFLNELAHKLLQANTDRTAGVKVLDFSEVPSDMLPLAVSLAACLVFRLQQWSRPSSRLPIALVCDEAHLYLPKRSQANAAESRALTHFERIAKEGRKYGLSLVIVSQRPSELNPAVMSQCNNVIALRLSSAVDKKAVADYLPDHISGIYEMLPSLGVGEAVVVGDACLLPSRIIMDPPAYKPKSTSIRFWDEWGKSENEQNVSEAVRNWRRQGAISTCEDE